MLGYEQYELSLPVMVGKQQSFDINKQTGMVEVSASIYATSDLCTPHPLTLRFRVNLNEKPENNVQIFTESADVFENCAIVKSSTNILVQDHFGNNELRIPWLDGYKYPLSAYYYSVRLMLKRDSTSGDSTSMPWSNPFSLRHVFPHKDTHFVNNKQAGSLSTSSLRILTGSARHRGIRPYMEDCDFTEKGMRLSSSFANVDLVSILDGHGGDGCAQFMVDEYVDILSNAAKEAESNASLQEVFYHSIVNADRDFLKSTSSGAGSTACLMLFDPNGCDGEGTCIIASVGDSRAVLSRRGEALDLTIDHKATAGEEVARIALAGGFVNNGRVMGSLAVGRSLGDKSLKRGRNLNKKPWSTNEEALSGIPDMLSFTPRRSGAEDDEFVIIATDGLWDVMTSQEAVDDVKRSLDKVSAGEVNGALLARIADQMVLKAVDTLGTRDNVSASIVYFTGSNNVGSDTDIKESSTTAHRYGSYEQDQNVENMSSQMRTDNSARFSRYNGNTFGADSKHSYASSSNDSSNDAKGVKAGEAKDCMASKSMDDDDLMEFLLDDKNF